MSVQENEEMAKQAPRDQSQSTHESVLTFPAPEPSLLCSSTLCGIDKAVHMHWVEYIECYTHQGNSKTYSFWRLFPASQYSDGSF